MSWYKVIFNGVFTFGTLVNASNADEARESADNEVKDRIGSDFYYEIKEVSVTTAEEEMTATPVVNYQTVFENHELLVIYSTFPNPPVILEMIEKGWNVKPAVDGEFGWYHIFSK